jgi:hypothetical protein
MIRPALIEIALFVAPFVLYAAFLMATKASVPQQKLWAPRRLTALLIAAFVLMIGGLVVLAEFTGAPPGSTYVPAHVEDGKFVPGRLQ